MLGVRYNRILFRRINMKIEFNSQRREMGEGVTIRFLPVIRSQISDKLLWSKQLTIFAVKRWLTLVWYKSVTHDPLARIDWDRKCIVSIMNGYLLWIEKINDWWQLLGNLWKRLQRLSSAPHILFHHARPLAWSLAQIDCDRVYRIVTRALNMFGPEYLRINYFHIFSLFLFT